MPRLNETLDISSTPTVIAFQTCLCILLLITGVLGNGIICYLVIRFKALRTIPNILLTNLAAVDLLNIITNTPMIMLIFVYNVKALQEKTAALLSVFLVIVFTQLNLSSMLLLVLDRYLLLAHPFKYRLWRTHNKTFCAICSVWVWALSISGYVISSANDTQLRQTTHEKSYYNAIGKRITKENYLLPITLSVFTPNFIFSILTIREVLKKKPLNTSSNGLQNLRRNGRGTQTTNQRSAITIIIVLLAYAVCFLCGSLFAITASVLDSRQWFFATIFARLCGSTCNSVIYTVRSTEFRNALRQTFKCNRVFNNRVYTCQKNAGKVFYIKSAFGRKVVVVE